jgi:hypothetical protein
VRTSNSRTVDVTTEFSNTHNGITFHQYSKLILESLEAEMDMNKAWETIRENIKISAQEVLGCYELKKHKLWFNEGCSELLDQRKQAKLQ